MLQKNLRTPPDPRDAEELATLQTTFLASPWAARTPVDVEVPFEMAIGPTVVRGRIDAVFAEQAVQMDRAKRETMLHRLQQLVHEKTIYAPIWQLAFISGVGPKVGQSGFGLIKGFVYTAPYEDLTLKGKA